jgi:hypothetical protein
MGKEAKNSIVSGCEVIIWIRDKYNKGVKNG